MHPWKRKVLFQTIIFTFYVNLPGGRSLGTSQPLSVALVPFCTASVAAAVAAVAACVASCAAWAATEAAAPAAPAALGALG